MNVTRIDEINPMYSPETLFGSEFNNEEAGVVFRGIIEASQHFERERTLTFSDLDKIAFIGTVTGAGRMAKGIIISALYAIVLLGQLSIYLEVNLTLTKTICTELQNVKKGFIALFPVVGGRVLVWIERMEDRQIIEDALEIDLDAIDKKFDVDVDMFLEMGYDLEDPMDDVDMVDFEELEQYFKALSQRDSFVHEGNPSVEGPVLDDDLEDSVGNDDALDFDILEQRFQALSQRDSFVHEGNPSVEGPVLDDEAIEKLFLSMRVLSGEA